MCFYYSRKKRLQEGGGDGTISERPVRCSPCAFPSLCSACGVAYWRTVTYKARLYNRTSVIWIIVLFISIMLGIYNHIPRKSHVSRLYIVAAVLYLQFVLRVMLFCPWNMFSTCTLAYCATNRKVAGSIPDAVIGIFHWHSPSDRTMALGSTQLLI
jgi:hypothetical protein